MTPSSEPVDLAILGAGSGGYAAALRAAELGMSVVMVERDKVGGTCLHRGCIPTKALLHAAEVADNAKDGPEKFGVKSTFDGIDMAGVNSYKDGVVSKLYKGLTGLVKSRKHRGRRGRGPAGEPDQRCRSATARSRPATSSSRPARSPSRCPASPIDGERVITSDHALTLDRVPEVGHRARRRRHRLRVRVGVELVRRRRSRSSRRCRTWCRPRRSPRPSCWSAPFRRTGHRASTSAPS